jgi:hypothetical protein
MAKFLEKRHEVSTTSRVADIRPFSVKAAEWLSSPWSMLFCAVPLALVPIVLPILALPMALGYLVVVVTYLVNRPVLPLRYPAAQPALAPKGKAEGILLIRPH